MLRLSGLPPADRFPVATLGRQADGLRLRFTGAGGTRTIEIPAWTVQGEDLEAVQLRLLADLRQLGYQVSLERPGEGG